MVRDVAGSRDARTRRSRWWYERHLERGQFTGQVAQDYMNPYLDTVLDRQKTAAIRDFNRMGAARNADAVKQGAFGGSRTAVADYLAQEGLQQQLAILMLWVERPRLETHKQRLIEIDRQV